MNIFFHIEYVTLLTISQSECLNVKNDRREHGVFLFFAECFGVVGNRLFYFQTNRERKIDDKKIGYKKGFLSFYSVCMFVCVFVCLCVCLSLAAL